MAEYNYYSASASEPWKSIALVSKEINLELTLCSGQAFRWVRVEGGKWSGAIGEKLYVLRHHGDVLQYQVSTPSSDPVDDRHTLEHYFRLDFDLTNLYTGWSEDENFREKAAWCQGVRLLQQPALETLVAFICSSNNNIIRISTMMNRFCKQYGQCLGTIAGHTFHSFPSLQSLVGVVNEDTLRDMGFGYRARYVKESVEEVGRRGGEAWLSLLRKLPYCEAWAKLCQLPGVGAKVADCVCLMGLGHLEAVPVDVHVLRLAQRDYGVDQATGLTSKAYRTVGDRFQDMFGATAGWAQAVLFTAELQQQKQCPTTARGRGEGRRVEGGRRSKRLQGQANSPQSKRNKRLSK